MWGNIRIHAERMYDIIPSLIDAAKIYHPTQKVLYDQVYSVLAHYSTKKNAEYDDHIHSHETILSHQEIWKKVDALFDITQAVKALFDDKAFLYNKKKYQDMKNILSTLIDQYNTSVNNHNNARISFPSNVLAYYWNHNHIHQMK